MHPLTEFLQAKFHLDQRSLNSAVWKAFIGHITDYDQLQLLDVGTGTGSMLRRLIQIPCAGKISLTGLDQEAELLDIAVVEIGDILHQQGFKLSTQQQKIIGNKPPNSVKFSPVCTPLSKFIAPNESYHVITAHGFMDLIPLFKTLIDFNQWLIPGGLFYSTINYDNETVIFPPYQDSDLEQQILMTYDNSMESRCSKGLKTGGAKCGRRLFQSMQQTGFKLLAYGSSDWNIVPLNGNYRDDDQVVLQYLLKWIFSEAKNNPSIDVRNLTHWYHSRLQQLSDSQLGIIIHQLDLLAQKV